MDMVIPFVVEGWHEPAGRRSCEPRPLAQARQDRERHRRWVPLTWDPGRQVESKDNQRRQPNSRSGRDPGLRPYARIRPKPRRHARSGEAGPEARSTSSLPNISVWMVRVACENLHADRPVMAVTVPAYRTTMPIKDDRNVKEDHRHNMHE